MARQPMSMEAMLDEERREVLALLEGRPAQPPRPAAIAAGVRSASPYSPRSPMRSMLDLGTGNARSPVRSASTSTGQMSPQPGPAVRSMLDLDSPPAPPVRSMLDIGRAPASATGQPLSAQTSPTESNYRAHAANNTVHPRSMSDSATKQPEFSPRLSQTRIDPTSDYQFSDIITSQQGPMLPKRVLQGGRYGGSMAEVMRGGDVGSLALPAPGGRHYSTAGIHGSHKSKSPHNRMGMRSNSPHIALAGRPVSPAGRAMLRDSLPVHINNAYRRLSDANLARSGGSLSELTRRKRSDDRTMAGRLTKDYLSPDGDILAEDSSDEHEHSSSEEDERGRKALRSFPDDETVGKAPVSEFGKKGRQTLSLLAAAEEERLHVAATQPYRSLLDDPEITITNPSGEKTKSSKSGVRPATSFEVPSRSASRAPMDSDEEADYSDIKRAQKLSFSMTPIISHVDAHRAIRIIYRGEYSKIQQEAEDEHRRLRKYLVATDQSDESTHALEWAVGTVLRDGDTLIAIYCVDEETGIVTGDNVLIPDEPKAMKEQAAAIHAVTASKFPPVASSAMFNVQHQPSALTRAIHMAQSTAAAASSNRERTKAEEERFRAVNDITERVTRLLRKTRLQVRVIVEVLHCKNPRHLITEVIDLVNPTLVILGSRGRSALKGVILGSFSNYLVTKSSVPVMVARKRLRKQSKYKRGPVHQVNNLNNPTVKSLANAKID